MLYDLCDYSGGDSHRWQTGRTPWLKTTLQIPNCHLAKMLPRPVRIPWIQVKIPEKMAPGTVVEMVMVMA